MDRDTSDAQPRVGRRRDTTRHRSVEEFEAHLDIATKTALTVFADDFDVFRRCVAPIGGFAQMYCDCVCGPTRRFCSDKDKGVIAHIRGTKKTAFASTAGLFESWSAIGNATEAYKLVRSFVVDLKKFALADSLVAQPVTVRQEPKRNVCDAPEPSASEPKRCKPDAAGTEFIIVEDDSDPEDCVIIERPEPPPPRCAGNRAPPLPPATSLACLGLDCSSTKPEDLPACRYGALCYRLNPVRSCRHAHACPSRLVFDWSSSIARPRVAGTFQEVLASALLRMM